MDFKELIFEVSPHRSEILKDIDGDFSNIRKDKKSLAAKKALIKHMKDFSGVNNIVITIKKDYFNAAVIPIYTQAFSLDLINLFKDYKIEGDIKNLEVVEEPAKYIKKLYIILGDTLIDTFSSRELTAILLHELGHSFTHTANLPRLLLALFQKGVGIAGFTLRIPILMMFKAITFPIYLASTLIIMTLVRSLTFLEHKSEYKADQFASKYGYGDEMIKVLYKLHNKESEEKLKQHWWDKILKFISSLFVPSSHPPSSSRIKEVNEQLLDDYKKMYPKLSKELNVILQNINTSS